MHGNGRLVRSTVTDSCGYAWNLHGIRIFDEGYGIIDVYADFMSSMEDEALYEDALASPPYPAAACRIRRRQEAGGMSNSRLNARLNAASDS